MSLQTAPLAGEIVTVGPGDTAKQAAFFSGGQPGRVPPQNQSRGPQQPVLPKVQQVGGAARPKAFQTRFRQGAHMQAPESAPTSQQRMAVVIWNGGWWNETATMLQGFIRHDGRQERRLLLVDTDNYPAPPEILMLAQAAFTDVQVHRCQFTLANGLSSPRSLISASGFLYERLRHLGSAFYTYPLEVLAPGSLDRLESEHRESTQTGRMLLGVIDGDGENRRPYGSFVAHREWIYDPNFPLAQGVGMNEQSMKAMLYMRFEMFKSFRITKVIQPLASMIPDRGTYLRAFDLFKIPREQPFTMAAGPIPHQSEPNITTNDMLEALINEANDPGIREGAPLFDPYPLLPIAAHTPPQEDEPEPDVETPALPVKDFPDDTTLKQLVKRHGLGIILDEGWTHSLIERAQTEPFLLNALAIAHKAYTKALADL